MLLCKKTTIKEPTIKVSRSGSKQEEELYSLEAVYDHTRRLLEKGGDSVKWGEVFYMFKRHTLPVEA
jgi:hypothetical protein